MPLSFDAAANKLGHMLLSFQWLEQMVALLATSSEAEGDQCVDSISVDEKGFAALADRAMKSARNALLVKWKTAEAPQHVESVEKLIEKARALARERNRLVHAAFITLGAGDQELVVFVERGKSDLAFIDDQRIDGLILEMRACATAINRVNFGLGLLKTKHEHDIRPAMGGTDKGAC